jgi:hypothetical protein
MSKRAPCSPVASWNSGQLGDCAQHLRTGECPVVSGIAITRRGGAYSSPPTVIFANGGPNATGAYAIPLMSCSGGSGVVTGVILITSGWHFTQSPTILFSGKFAPAAAQTGACMQGTTSCNENTPWNDSTCMCSGSGLILGFPVYQNITLLPPQCSNLFESGNWQDLVNATGAGALPICTQTCLDKIGTTNYGRCQVDGTECNCVTSFESGWVQGDCGSGPWGKTDNYCFTNGSQAPRGKCSGPWTTCDKPITNRWRKTDQFLDFGVCTKRGHKNVVAMKSWHGEMPFNIIPNGCNRCLNCTTCSGASNGHLCWDCSLDANNIVNCNSCSEMISGSDSGTEYLNCTHCTNCSDCPNGQNNYTYKYKAASFTYSDVLTVTNPPQNTDFGWNVSMGLSASVGRLNGQVTESMSLSATARNNLFGGGIPSMSPNFLDRCNQTVGGYPVSGWIGRPWNYTEILTGDNGFYSLDSVTTTASLSDNTITFHQVLDTIFILVSGLAHDLHSHRVIDATTVISSPYFNTELNADVNTLLNQWNLLDDTIYPWKYGNDDELIIPKVTYCESSPASPLDAAFNAVSNCPSAPLCHYCFSSDDCSHCWDSCTGEPECVTGGGFHAKYHTTCSFSSGGCGANCSYNGAILGAPSALGQIGYVDFNRINILMEPCNCDGEDGGAATALTTVSWGGPASLPHATQQLNFREQQIIYPGAFSSINDRTRLNETCNNGFETPYIGSDVLIKAKYAEIIQIDKPSQNFRLPCGVGSSKDLIFVNETDGSVIPYLSASTGCVQPCICTGCGTGSSQACTNGASPSRWPKFSGIAFVCNTALSIVSGTISTGKMELYTNSGNSGIRGQFVNAFITFPSGVQLLDTFEIATVLSSTGIVITGDFTIYLGMASGIGGWLDFATGNDWFDNYPKGDFVVRSWDYHPYTGHGWNTKTDAYLNSINATEYCLPYKSCEPSFVVIGPSGSPEASSGGRNMIFVTMPDITPQVCGAKTHYIPEQWRTDALWMRPTMPCCLVSGLDSRNCQVHDDDEDGGFMTNIVHLWEEDDGSCRDVETEYLVGGGGGISIIYRHHYPMRPWVEAKQNRLGIYPLPTDACSFLTAAQLLNAQSGCLSVATIEALNGTTYSGLRALDWSMLTCLCDPPFAGSSYWGTYKPWVIAANQEICLREAAQTTGT